MVLSFKTTVQPLFRKCSFMKDKFTVSDTNSFGIKILFTCILAKAHS